MIYAITKPRPIHLVLRALLGRVAAAMRERAGRTIEHMRRRREARATFMALHQLDAATLRDLGWHRSELASVTAESAGLAPRTRQRV